MQSAVAEPISAEPSAADEPALVVRRCLTFEEAAQVVSEDLVFDAPGVEAVAALCAGIVLSSGDEHRAATLFAAGADCLFIGEAALRDSTTIGRLVAAHGADRIGIYAPLRRQSVSWSFETVSNADFKTVTPSHCEPAWEVLNADGSGTGTLASWWLAAMRDLGASHFLVHVDICDDTDLNLCAGLIEEFGEALWIGPLTDARPQLSDWVAYGQCRRLALHSAAYSYYTNLLTEDTSCT